MIKLKRGLVIGNRKLIEEKFRRGKVAYWTVQCLICGKEYLLSAWCCRKDRPCKFCHREKTKRLVCGYFKIKSRRQVEY